MTRLTLSLVLVVLAAVVGLGWAFDHWYASRYSSEEEPAIENYRNLGRQFLQLIEATHADEKTLHAWAQKSSGQIQFTPYVDFPLPENLKQTFESGEPLLLDSQSKMSLHYYLPRHHLVASFNFVGASQPTNSRLFSWVLTLLFYGGLVMLLLIWLYPLLTRLNLLRRTARAFGSGDLAARIAPGKVTYIATIEREFNSMAQRIENLISDNKLLSRGLSHDLRTPIARLRFGLDVLDEADLSPSQHKTLQHLNRDLVAMESLVETLLKYARLEQSNIALKLQPINLQILVGDLLAGFYDTLVTFNTINLGADNGFVVDADPEYLTMLIHNLLQNAQRHGHGKINLSLRSEMSAVILTIEDNGQGIPVEERQNVLKPFYRAKAAQSTQGHGMGLAIVDRIAQWHKAEVILGESPTLGGLRVDIIFRKWAH